MIKLLICLFAAASPMAAWAADAPAPAVTIKLGSRHAHVTPVREGFTHTGGGNIDVAQPAPDTVVITMTGVAVAGAHPYKASSAAVNFDLEQCFEIAFEKPEVKKASLTLEGRVIGLLRSECKGSAEEAPGTAVVSCGPANLLSLVVPPHAVTGGDNLSINCHEGPVAGPIASGKYTLTGKWAVTASHPCSLRLCKAASSEFAPDPALDPLWISYWEPFHGAAKKDFGFQITVKVAPDNGGAGDNAKP